MKKYVNFDQYLADQPKSNKSLITLIRKFVKSTAPELTEAVKWGNGCWLLDKAFVAYVYSDNGFIQFGFTRGSSLKDPKKLLQGKGQYVRHIKVYKPADIDKKYFADLLQQAIKAMP